VKFFPVAGPIFQIAHVQAERFEFANTPGQKTYSWIALDRDSWADVEQYSYPLHVCPMQAPDAGKIN
jgi:hypothetical protein